MPCFSVPFTALYWSCPAYSRSIPTYSQWVRGHSGTQGTLTKFIRVFLHDFRVCRASSRQIPSSAPMLRGPYGTPSGYSAFLPASYHVIPFSYMILWTLAGLDGSMADYHQLSAVTLRHDRNCRSVVGNIADQLLPPCLATGDGQVNDWWWLVVSQTIQSVVALLRSTNGHSMWIDRFVADSNLISPFPSC